MVSSARSSAARMISISASIAGLSMPARLYEPLVRGRLRREERPHAVARRRRHAEAFDRDVEIEIVDAGAVLHGIDQPQRRLDAERAEILDEGRVMRLQRRFVDAETRCVSGSPFGSTRLPSLIAQPASLQQLRRLAQQRAILTRTVGHRRHDRARRTLRPAPGRGTARAAPVPPATAARPPSCRNSGTANACAHRRRT